MEKVNVFECLVLYGFFIHWGKIDFDGFWEVIFLLFFFFFFVFGFEGRNLGKRKKMEGRFSKEGLDESTVHSMVISNVFSDHSAPINSMDFYVDGTILATASDDESIHVYNCVEGTMKKKIYSKKYGVSLLRFTNHKESIVCASNNGWDESLRYLSLHSNQYLRYFKGHRDRVISLAMSPKDDLFLSSSLDSTVRLWDLNSPNCQGMIRGRGRSVVGFCPSGKVFSIATENNTCHLFSVQKFENSSFMNFKVNHLNQKLEWSSVKFSPDGKMILLASLNGYMFLYDAYDGTLLHTLVGHKQTHGMETEPCFSPDGQFVLCGDEEGYIHVWNAITGKHISILTGQHQAPVRSVLWNPTYMVLASACSNLALWQPLK